jgi:hypothetical protein
MILSYFFAQVYIISVFRKAVLFAKEKLEGIFTSFTVCLHAGTFTIKTEPVPTK